MQYLERNSKDLKYFIIFLRETLTESMYSDKTDVALPFIEHFLLHYLQISPGIFKDLSGELSSRLLFGRPEVVVNVDDTYLVHMHA